MSRRCREPSCIKHIHRVSHHSTLTIKQLMNDHPKMTQCEPSPSVFAPWIRVAVSWSIDSEDVHRSIRKSRMLLIDNMCLVLQYRYGSGYNLFEMEMVQLLCKLLDHGIPDLLVEPGRMCKDDGDVRALDVARFSMRLML